MYDIINDEHLFYICSLYRVSSNRNELTFFLKIVHVPYHITLTVIILEILKMIN